MFYVKEDILNINNIKMNYITFGKGTIPLIMIQGLNTRGIKGAGISLAYMYRIFSKDYKVYLFDRRNDIKEDITIDFLADDIILAMDYLNIRNADILGVSQGGMIAQSIAIRRPDLVHKLVLAVTLSKNNDTVIEVINNWIRLTNQNKMKELVYDMAIKMYSSTYVKRYQRFMPLLTLIQKPKDIKRFIILAKSCLTCNTYNDLDKIKCPVLVIGGKEDKIVTGEASIDIADKLNCELYIYDSLGHAAYEETKDFNKKVYEFFRQNERRA